VTNGPSATLSRNNPGGAGAQRFPRSKRLTRSAEFRLVYDRGIRVVSPYFTAFCWQSGGGEPRIGFTTPRALGKAVVRNRMRRRVRETVRRRLSLIAPGWWIVFNLRKPSLDAPQPDLDAAVDRVVSRCAA
jgi:ribonuclease P protein component